jgi:hypothetical protein
MRQASARNQRSVGLMIKLEPTIATLSEFSGGQGIACRYAQPEPQYAR